MTEALKRNPRGLDQTSHQHYHHQQKHEGQQSSPGQRTPPIRTRFMYILFLLLVVHTTWSEIHHLMISTTSTTTNYDSDCNTRGSSSLMKKRSNDITNWSTTNHYDQHGPRHQLPEVVMTDFGWLQPNETLAQREPRCLAVKEFYLAIEAHERYNATAWHDLNQHPDPNRPIIAFLDVDTLGLLHWPKFGGSWETNSDLVGGRLPMKPPFGPQLCEWALRALSSPAMTASPDSRLVVLNGDPNGQHPNAECLQPYRNETAFQKLIVGHMSAHTNHTHRYDFGLPSWPVRTVNLSEKVRHDIEDCKDLNRTYLYAFQGRHRVHFTEFHEYLEKEIASQSNQTRQQQEQQQIYANFGFDHYLKSNETNEWGGMVISPLAQENQTQDDYYRLMMQSSFCPTPRGDKLYSVRFGEVMSAGCIPVILADGWILPYNKDVVDWSELSVLLPEKQVRNMSSTLKAIPLQKRCEMQQRVLEVYDSYIKDSHGRLRAILKLTDARVEQERHVRDAQNKMRTYSSVPDE